MAQKKIITFFLCTIIFLSITVNSSEIRTQYNDISVSHDPDNIKVEAIIHHKKLNTTIMSNNTVLLRSMENWTLQNSTIRIKYTKQPFINITLSNFSTSYELWYVNGFAYKLKSKIEYLESVVIPFSSNPPEPDWPYNLTLEIWTVRNGAPAELIACNWTTISLGQENANVTFRMNTVLPWYFTENDIYYFLFYSNFSMYAGLGIGSRQEHSWALHYDPETGELWHHNVYAVAAILCIAPGMDRLPRPFEVNFTINGIPPSSYTILNDSIIIETVLIGESVLGFNVNWYIPFQMDVLVYSYENSTIIGMLETEDNNNIINYSITFEIPSEYFGETNFTIKGPPGAVVTSVELNNTAINYSLFFIDFITQVQIVNHHGRGEYLVKMYARKSNYFIESPNVVGKNKEFEIVINYTSYNGTPLFARVFMNNSFTQSLIDGMNILRLRAPPEEGKWYLYLYFDSDQWDPHVGCEIVLEIEVISPYKAWFDLNARNVSFGEIAIVMISLRDENSLINGSYNLTLKTKKNEVIEIDYVEVFGSYILPIYMSTAITEIEIYLTYKGDITHDPCESKIVLVPQKKIPEINVNWSLSWLRLSIDISTNETYINNGIVKIEITDGEYHYLHSFQLIDGHLHIEIDLPPIASVVLKIILEEGETYTSIEKKYIILTVIEYLKFLPYFFLVFITVVAGKKVLRIVTRLEKTKKYNSILYIEFIDSSIGTSILSHSKYPGLFDEDVVDGLETYLPEFVQRAAHDAIEIRVIVGRRISLKKELYKLAIILSQSVGSDIRETHILSQVAKNAINSAVMTVFHVKKVFAQNNIAQEKIDEFRRLIIEMVRNPTQTVKEKIISMLEKF